jgi:hypothetical protein
MIDVKLRDGGGRCEGKREREGGRRQSEGQKRGVFIQHERPRGTQQPPVTRFFDTLTLLQYGTLLA